MRPYLYIARHGETEWNVAGRLQGLASSPLTPRGLAHAEALAFFAARVGVTRIFSSPLERAIVTATAVAMATRSPIERCEALREIDLGACSALTLDEAAAQHAHFFRARKTNPWSVAWPGGESYSQAFDRVGDWLSNHSPFERGTDTMIVAHEAVNRVLLMHLAGIKFDAARAMKQPAHVLLRVDETGRLCHTSVAPTADIARPPWQPGLSAA
jgi:probable phosphoglycerate mutase